ncbi:hypothetical protein M0R19_00875 [Candidatus Pacearchaeota archaeon]|nr:hypothetical protein [Candidatus Pacearchaeota archaeon]
MTEKLLWMCAVCKKIKDEYGNMFGEKDNPERYNNLIKNMRVTLLKVCVMKIWLNN